MYRKFKTNTKSRNKGDHETEALKKVMNQYFKIGFKYGTSDEDKALLFKDLFLREFEIKQRYDHKVGKPRTAIRLRAFKEEGYTLNVHYEDIMFDEIAAIIVFLIKEQFNNIITELGGRNPYMTMEKFFFSKNNPGIAFPPIVIHPSVKFDRMKIQEGAFSIKFHKLML